jgi:hypothetical protein
MRLLRLLLLALLAAAPVASVRAGVAPFTDPGKIDFDTAIELLNPYGTWAKVGDKWAYTPLDHAVPYTNGRWLYSEYGWLWKGNSPTSWVTEHYGYWKRGADKVWAWYPGPNWLPQIVEIRASPAGIGWRSAEVDSSGNFVEDPSVRFTKTDEWTFVTPAVFAGPITPAVIAKPAQAVQLLEQSTESIHSYLTYREIDRPGPHPADFINFGDGGMFAPMTAAERFKALHPLVAAAKATPAKPDPAKIAASLTASDALPEIPQQPGATDPNDDPRQVKYWVTMSLPDFWTKPPADARMNEVYLYRPDIYQDEDGIGRRIAFWLDPALRSSEAIHLADVLKHRPIPAAPSAYSSAPATPAAAVSNVQSPFESPFRSASGTESTKAPSPAPAAATNAANAPAPDGRAAQP